MDFALTKENIQPLRGGRNAVQLEIGLQAQHNPQYQEALLQQKQHFDNAIRNDNGDDPLENYFQYISWVEQSFPKHGHEGNLANLLEDCLGRFENDHRYTHDIRYCKLWIKYIDFQHNHTELYQLLYTKGIGIGFADLYKAWAYYYEAAGDFRRADQVYRLGKDQRAQPFQELEAAHHNFYYYAGFQMVNQGTADAAARLADQRQALTNLRTFKPGQVGSMRTPAGGLSVLPMNENLQNRINPPVVVHEEYQDILLGLGAPAGSILSAVKRDGHKENITKAGVWTGSVKKSHIVHKSSNIPIHEDVLPPPHVRGFQMPSTFVSHTQADSAEWKVDICVPDPDDPSKIPMYCKQQCYEDSTTEYSIEEVRARRYLRKMKRQLSLSSAMETDHVMQRSNNSMESARHINPQEAISYQHSQLEAMHSNTVQSNSAMSNMQRSPPQTVMNTPVMGAALPSRVPLMDHAMQRTNTHMECTSAMTSLHRSPPQHVSIAPAMASRITPYESPPSQMQSFQQHPSTSVGMIHQYNPHAHNSPSMQHHNSHQFNHSHQQQQHQQPHQQQQHQQPHQQQQHQQPHQQQQHQQPHQQQQHQQPHQQQPHQQHQQQQEPHHQQHQQQQHQQQHSMANSMHMSPHHSVSAHSLQLQNPMHASPVMHSVPNMHRSPAMHMAAVRHPSPYRNQLMPYDAQSMHQPHQQQQLNQQQQHHQSPMLNSDSMLHHSASMQQQHHQYHQQQHQNAMAYGNVSVQSPHVQATYSSTNLVQQNVKTQFNQSLVSSPCHSTPSPHHSLAAVWANESVPKSAEFDKSPMQDWSARLQLAETKGKAMKTQTLKMLNDDELAETGSRGGLDIAAAAQPTDGAKRITCYEDEDSFTGYLEPCKPSDFSIAENTEAFNLQAIYVSTPENKKPEEPTTAVEVKSTKKRLFSGLADITEESNYISSGSSAGATSLSNQVAPRSAFGIPRANAMEPIREHGRNYQLNFAQNMMANAELRMKLGLGCDSGSNSPTVQPPLTYDHTNQKQPPVISVFEDDEEEEAEEPVKHEPYTVLNYQPTDPFTNKVLEKFLTHVNFPGRHSRYYKQINVIPKLMVKKDACYVGNDRYFVDKLLGKGTFGSVFKATRIDTGAVVALKLQKPANKWEFYICREIQARLADHPLRENFMNVHLAYFNDLASVLVSDVHHGSLLNLINAVKANLKNGPKHHLSIYFTSEMMKIVQALHSIKIIHADIKPDNFLVMVKNDCVQLQLIDFGCSIDMSLMPEGTSFMRKVKTDSFQCCEMKDDRPWNYHTDIYCIAATAHVLLLESYIDLKKIDGRWYITKKIPRYYRDDLWSLFFNSMMNMQEGLPDMDYLISYFGDAIDHKELRTATNYIINSFKN